MKTDFLLHFIFPKRCPVCDRPLSVSESKRGFCVSCVTKLPVIRQRRCYICGRQLRDQTSEYCHDCLLHTQRRFFDKGLSLCTYDDVMRACIYRFKYGGRCEYAETFGKMMAQNFGHAFLRAGAEGVIAVPLHQKRKRERGYNQAELLAKGFCAHSGIPYYKNYVVRTKNTEPMKLLDPVKRQNNLKKAFKIGRNDVKLNIIIIIDDIYTTGSTIDAVSKVLRESGVKKIYFLTLAIGSDY